MKELPFTPFQRTFATSTLITIAIHRNFNMAINCEFLVRRNAWIQEDLKFPEDIAKAGWQPGGSTCFEGESGIKLLNGRSQKASQLWLFDRLTGKKMQRWSPLLEEKSCSSFCSQIVLPWELKMGVEDLNIHGFLRSCSECIEKMMSGEVIKINGGIAILELKNPAWFHLTPICLEKQLKIVNGCADENWWALIQRFSR